MLWRILSVVLVSRAFCLQVADWDDGVRPTRRSHGPDSLTCDADEGSLLRQRGEQEESTVTRRRKRTDEAIIGGSVVKSSAKYPFLAWIGDSRAKGLRQYCAGTLISDRLVLTAAHCLYSSDDKNAGILVRVGLANFLDESGEQRMIVGWRHHEGFDRTGMREDIALMLLNASVENSAVMPVRLSNGSKLWETAGVKSLVGWGSTEENCDHYDAELRDAPVHQGKFGFQCSVPGSRQVGPIDDFNPIKQMCAGDYEKGRAKYPSCGDSGGPLLARDAHGWVQIGLVSWSYGAPYPDVFTRISAYRRWIEETGDALLREDAQRSLDRELPPAQETIPALLQEDRRRLDDNATLLVANNTFVHEDIWNPAPN